MPPRQFLFALACLTVASRVAVLLWLRTYAGDAGAYEHDEIARSLVAGEGFRYRFFTDVPELTGHQAPVMPYLLAAGYTLFGVGSAAGKLAVEVVQAVLAGGAAAALGWIAWQWWGRRAMVITMVGFLAYPAFAYMPTRIQAVNWALTFLCLALAGFVALARRPGGHRMAWLTGIAGGLGALGEPILAAPFGLCWLWLAWTQRAQWRVPAAVAAGCALTLAPWAARNTMALGAAGFVKSSFWYVAWQGNHPGASGTDKRPVAPEVARALAWRVAGGRETDHLLDEARMQAVSVDLALTAADSAALRALATERERMQWFRTRLARELAADPGAYGTVVARRAAMLVWFDPTNPRAFVFWYRAPYVVLALLAAAGLVLLARGPTRPPGAASWGLAVGGLVLVHLLIIMSARFRLPVEALLLLPAAYAVLRLLPSPTPLKTR